MTNAISINEFRKEIGWTPNNYPYSVSSLKLVNGHSGVKLGGAFINGTHYNVYYNEDILGGVIYFPIVFTNGSNSYKVSDATDLEAFLNGELKSTENPLTEQNERLHGFEYAKIRQHEVSHPNRIVFGELYSWSKEQFYGYQYMEC
jgi:hypothetical protein